MRRWRADTDPCRRTAHRPPAGRVRRTPRRSDRPHRSMPCRTARSDSHAIAPTMPGTISAANGPSVRMRLRYQRGPSMSGAERHAASPATGSSGGTCRSARRRARWERGGVRIHNGPSVRRGPQPRPAPPVTSHDVRRFADRPIVLLVARGGGGGRGPGRSPSASCSCSPGRPPSAVSSLARRAGAPPTCAAGGGAGRSLGAVRSDHAWNGLAADQLGPLRGLGAPGRRSASRFRPPRASCSTSTASGSRRGLVVGPSSNESATGAAGTGSP